MCTMTKTRSMKDTAASSKGDGDEETNATILVAEEHVQIQEQDDSEETLSVPRGQAVQAATGTVGLTALTQFLDSLSDKLSFLQAIEEEIRGLNKKLEDNNQQVLDTHQAAMEKIDRNQELLLEKIQSGGGSTPISPAEDVPKTCRGQSPKMTIHEANQRPGKQVTETYQPPHKREETMKKNSSKTPGHSYSAPLMIQEAGDRIGVDTQSWKEEHKNPNNFGRQGNSKNTVHLHGYTGPQVQPACYEPERPTSGSGGTYGEKTGPYVPGSRMPQQPSPQALSRELIDASVLREMVQEILGPAFCPIQRPEFRKPYPEHVDQEPLPRGVRIPDFALFSGEEGQSTLEHVARFTTQCGEFSSFDSFPNILLRLFPNSLTGAAFAWYVSLPANSVFSWQDMQRLFDTQFYRTEPEICIAELSRVTQRAGERADDYIARFKTMRRKCKVNIPEIEYVKMAQQGLELELRKKF